MEKRKAKSGLTELLLAGIIFIGVGIVFLPIGILVTAQNIEGNPIVFKAVFCGMGALLLIVGVICLSLEISNRVRYNRMINSNQFIMAEITEITMNYALRVNGQHPYIVIGRYRDMYGNIHIFRSRNLNFDPTPLLTDQMVRVYVEGENFKHYYMDIDSVLPEVMPKVIRH